MKKSILAVAVLLGTSASFAQDLTSKKGENYLPEAGDWAVSIDATPLLGYVQGIFGSNGSSSAGSWAFLNGNNVITGKYFVADDMAYRGGINIGFTSNTMKAYTPALDNSGAVQPDAAPVVDEMKVSSSMIALTGGLEWRKGSGRLQGFYGGELGFMIASSSTSYTYGNAMTNTGAGTTDFGSNITTDTYGNGARVTEMKNGSMFGLGLRGFIGAEYFVLPKIAVGGEFGWGLVFVSNGASSTSIESTDGTSVGTQTLEGSKTSGFSLDTDNVNSVFGPAANLRMTFHF